MPSEKICCYRQHMLPHHVFTLHATNCRRGSFCALHRPLADIMWHHNRFSSSQLKKCVVTSHDVSKRSFQSKEGPIVAMWHAIGDIYFHTLCYLHVLSVTYVVIVLSVWISRAYLAQQQWFLHSFPWCHAVRMRLWMLLLSIFSPDILWSLNDDFFFFLNDHFMGNLGANMIQHVDQGYSDRHITSQSCHLPFPW